MTPSTRRVAAHTDRVGRAADRLRAVTCGDAGSMRTADSEVLERESYWKRVLLSREFGLNAN